MLRENVEAQCRKICRESAANGKNSVCAFAPRGGIVGFIDTSGVCDGSRGIAFFGDRMFVNTDGRPREITYRSIDGLSVISSFEDAFADELSVVTECEELRISDYSLDKHELKLLLEELCREQAQVAQRKAAQAERYAELIAQRLAEDALTEPYIGESIAVIPEIRELEEPAPTEYAEPNDGVQPVIAETVLEILEDRTLPEDYDPEPIPEEKIDWLSGKRSEPIIGTLVEEEPESRPKRRPKLPEVMNGVVDRIPVIGSIRPSKPKASPAVKVPEPPKITEDEENRERGEITESEIRERIENMSPNEVMEFLSETMNEINAISESSYRDDAFFDQNAETRILVEDVRRSVSGEESAPVSDVPVQRWKKLTVEPIWGDIYIKASQKLRELCESGKLSMEQMETELKERLLSAAEAFESLTSDSSRVPKVMIPKITELKAAAENFDHYFAFGEDIAIRSMFFMLYQMLTYADRIAESPETKDRLNDFFRRFGSAGITLSMLDMRV